MPPRIPSKGKPCSRWFWKRLTLWKVNDRTSFSVHRVTKNPKKVISMLKAASGIMTLFNCPVYPSHGGFVLSPHIFVTSVVTF